MENENLCIDAAQTSKRNRSHFVYALIDPISNAVRYVGCTTDILTRMKRHRTAPGVMAIWIGGLELIGLQPRVKMLQVCRDSATGMRAEYRWIRRFLRAGCDLLNINKRPETYEKTMRPKESRPGRRPRVTAARMEPMAAASREAIRAKRIAKWEAKQAKLAERRAAPTATAPAPSAARTA